VKRLIREDAINILIEHGVSELNATKIVDEYVAIGRLGDHQTKVALLLPEGSAEDFEIVDLGTHEVVEPTPIRTPRRRDHLKLVG
jgi:hypothetical protein